MSPLQYFRWRWGTRRAALATIRHLDRLGQQPSTLVDAGARNSEFMEHLALRWPKAKVHSFEMNHDCTPLGELHLGRLGKDHHLADYTFERPALLKLDVDADVMTVLRTTDLAAFDWVVIEITEDGTNGIPNNRSEITQTMYQAGFWKSHAVDAVVCVLEHRIAQTDVLFWRPQSRG